MRADLFRGHLLLGNDLRERPERDGFFEIRRIEFMEPLFGDFGNITRHEESF